MADRTDTPALATPTTDRRAFFSAAALLGVAAVLPGTTAAASAAALIPVAMPAADDDDGEAYTEADLIAFCGEWRVASDEYIPLSTRLGQMFEKDQSVADRIRLGEVEDAIHEMEEFIFETPARTMAGVQAKAGVLAYAIEVMDLAPTGEQSASLITDILALGSAA